MLNVRSVAVAVFLAVMLSRCGSGTSAGGAATASPSPSPGPTDLVGVQNVCVAKIAAQIKDFHFENLFTADEFFELSADHKTLLIVTPPPADGVPNRAFALSAGQCAFSESGAPAHLVNNLSVPSRGEQQARWIGFAGTWEGDDLSMGFRASVVGPNHP